MRTLNAYTLIPVAAWGPCIRQPLNIAAGCCQLTTASSWWRWKLEVGGSGWLPPWSPFSYTSPSRVELK